MKSAVNAIAQCLLALLMRVSGAGAQSISSITLQPGEYLWLSELASAGPLVSGI